MKEEMDNFAEAIARDDRRDALKLHMIPRLSQSRIRLMACPASFVATEVRGAKGANTPWNTLGKELHEIQEGWVRRVYTNPSETQTFEKAALMSCSEEAADILKYFWKEYVPFLGELVSTEFTLQGGDDLEGTLDCLLSMGDEFHILDWKSQHRIESPTGPQPLLYAYLVFVNYPEARSVTFQQVYLRYGGYTREVTWTRSQIPEMEESIGRWRARQVEMHARPHLFEDEAIPGSHCTYCPLLRMQHCPIEQWNPQSMPLEKRAQWVVYLKRALKASEEILKDRTAEYSFSFPSGDRQMTVGHVVKQTEQYPMGETLVKLMEWKEATRDAKNPDGDDLIADLHISRSALKAKLKTKKRAVLDQALQDIAEIEQHTQFEIREVEGGGHVAQR